METQFENTKHRNTISKTQYRLLVELAGLRRKFTASNSNLEHLYVNEFAPNNPMK